MINPKLTTALKVARKRRKKSLVAMNKRYWKEKEVIEKAHDKRYGVIENKFESETDLAFKRYFVPQKKKLKKVM